VADQATATNEPRGEFVFAMQTRIWIWLLFIVLLLYGLWFLAVMFGEQQGWTDNPGAWAGLETQYWALGGLVIFGIAVLIFLCLMARREIPATTYMRPLPTDTESETTPTFLQPADETPAVVGEPVAGEPENPPHS
jgi:hypothetical protein